MIGFQRGILLFPGLFQHFLRTVPFLQEFPVKFHEEGENPHIYFSPVTELFHIYGIPFRGAARRQEIPDDPIGKRKGIHLIAKLLQGPFRRFLPFPEAKEYIPGISSLCTSEDRIAGS